MQLSQSARLVPAGIGDSPIPPESLRRGEVYLGIIHTPGRASWHVILTPPEPVESAQREQAQQPYRPELPPLGSRVLMLEANAAMQAMLVAEQIAKLEAHVAALEARPPLTVIGGTVVHPDGTDALGNRMDRLSDTCNHTAELGDGFCSRCGEQLIRGREHAP